MNLNQKNRLLQQIDILGLSAIGAVVVGYVLGSSTFAERHIQFSFLNFPVFVGEFLLMFCAALFCTKIALQRCKLTKWHIIIGLYFLFVLVKAYFGYVKWGPLAFRHAALMYYPVFAVFGYSFYSDKIFGEKIKILILITIFSIFIYRDYYFYTTVVMFNVAVIVIMSLKNRKLRYVASLVLAVSMPYRYLFHTARMMLLAHMVFAIYIIAVGWKLIQCPKKYKILVILVGIFLIGAGAMRYAGPRRILSIFEINRHIEIFNMFDQRVQAKKDTFEFEELNNVQVYHPNPSKKATVIQDISPPNQQKGVGLEQKLTDKELKKRKTEQELDKLILDRKYNYAVDLNNAVFRLLVWRDMFEEYVAAGWPLFGFDYGKPLRSISIEILEWVASEWRRDGWVAPHNSFLHILYRSGLVGLLLITGLCVFLLRMIGGWLKQKNVTGLLLCGSILICFVAANFLVVLEAPYSAIPIWTLYGMTVRYFVLHGVVSQGDLTKIRVGNSKTQEV